MCNWQPIETAPRDGGGANFSGRPHGAIAQEALDHD